MRADQAWRLRARRPWTPAGLVAGRSGRPCRHCGAQRRCCPCRPGRWKYGDAPLLERRPGHRLGAQSLRLRAALPGRDNVKLRRIGRLAEEGALTPFLGPVLPFEQAEEATRLLISGTARGRIVLTMP
ncbi:zinc-binding dehydrogenase [Streptomyces sp. NPDC004675]|uniref:zinc-binding dehydrogenase n=1 Tax=Streptomyces sp. NPDC004675 TaxID=3154286 RepID=UPI0033A4F503